MATPPLRRASKITAYETGVPGIGSINMGSIDVSDWRLGITLRVDQHVIDYAPVAKLK
jgi:hypothetical protein